MARSRTRALALAGLLTAVGVLLPFLTAHALGIPGTILLPMHLPVLLMGLLCGWRFGALGGVTIPLLSSLLTGMPAVPMVFIMTGELMTYGLVSGLCRQKGRLPILPALLIAMVCGRVTYGLVYAVLLTANGGLLRAASVGTALIQGIPGIVLQWILIPLIMRYLTMLKRKQTDSDVLRQQEDQWKRLLQTEAVSCIVIKKAAIVHQAAGRGVKPLMELTDHRPELLRGAFVMDKIIGKAAAMLLVKCGAVRAYGEVMSVAAHRYLEAQGIRTDYGRCIDVISNREGSGICPLERSVLEIEDPEEGYLVLKETIRTLMGA